MVKELSTESTPEMGRKRLNRGHGCWSTAGGRPRSARRVLCPRPHPGGLSWDLANATVKLYVATAH